MSIFVLNVYSQPSRRKENFAYLLAVTFKLAKQNGVAVLGGFNAAHPAWVYGKATGLTVHTDPACPIRIGNSVSRDTCPDLTMSKRLVDAEWCNTEETLGSDHCILITMVSLIRKNSYIKKTRLVIWEEFHKQRETTSTSEITSFDEWGSTLQHDVPAYAKDIMLTDERQAVDPHLLHLWEARRSLIKRWRRQKHNRTLKIRIARLTEEAAHYAGTLGTTKTWSLLRHLLEPTKSKSATRHIIKKLLHQYPGTNMDILDALRDKYIGQQHPPSQPVEYRGAPNIQDALQRATDVVQRYARGGGLQCAHKKSQLLIVKKKCRNIPYDPPQLTLTLENQVIPQVTCTRILRLFLQQDDGGSHALQQKDVTRLIQALIISRVTYSVPYLTLKPREREKLEVLIRRSYKEALGLPPGTSTSRLLSLGIHNTVEEHIEATS
ncbi:hypothetical protein HPB47_027279 [Ixodes persulcatus]|uniref:Uncharacterized protein n=1 Tax=Ixodes persulcatus TaxID=34615 RepID=A0AC60PWE1_IXOPE|nr:hypothetical protein HPB47_027279 [Ixodes persulcatus]